MGNHYIPKYYLRGFTEPNDNDFIHRFERKTGAWIRANITKIAQENDLYSQELEEYLTQKIEQPSNAVLSKIRLKSSITLQEKQTLADYIVVLMRRVPSDLARTREWLDENAEPYFEQLERFLKSVIETDPDKKAVAEWRLNQIKEIKEGKHFDAKGVWFGIIDPSKFPKTRAAISSMKWQFYISDSPSFLTSDNSVFYFRQLGLGHPESEISFPVSSTIALLASWNNDAKQGYFSAKHPLIMQINRRTVSAAEKYVFSHSFADWKVSISKKNNLNLHMLV